MTGNRVSRLNRWLLLIGTLSLLTYGWKIYEWRYRFLDLRQNTIGFEIAFFIIFILYLAAVALILQSNSPISQSPNLPVSQSTLATPHSPLFTRHSPLPTWLIILLFALLPRLILLPMKPALSDDMYRYVWDGRLQNNGLNPYAYPPAAAEVAPYRAGDTAVWPNINRKPHITVYPPGAQMAYAAIWRVVGDSIIGFKAAFVLAELAGAWLLLHLLRALNQPPQRLLIYLWSPLLIFEVAHAGHIDALMLPFLILAFWARVKGRYGLMGAALGVGMLIKLFPLILLPALLPPLFAPSPQTDSLRHSGWIRRSAVSGRWSAVGRRPSAIGGRPFITAIATFVGVIAAGYLPYVASQHNALSFLPTYFDENFNVGLAGIIREVAKASGLPPSTYANLLTFGGIALLGAYYMLRPAADGRAALLRCVWLISWFTLFTQNLFPWYLLWLLPLIACFLEPGKLLGFQRSTMTAWFLFSGLIVLSYTFFIEWRVIAWVQLVEFLSLYALLLAAWLPHLFVRSGGFSRFPAEAATTNYHKIDDEKLQKRTQ